MTKFVDESVSMHAVINYKKNGSDFFFFFARFTIFSAQSGYCKVPIKFLGSHFDSVPFKCRRVSYGSNDGLDAGEHDRRSFPNDLLIYFFP